MDDAKAGKLYDYDNHPLVWPNLITDRDTIIDAMTRCDTGSCPSTNRAHEPSLPDQGMATSRFAARLARANVTRHDGMGLFHRNDKKKADLPY